MANEELVQHFELHMLPKMDVQIDVWQSIRPRLDWDYYGMSYFACVDRRSRVAICIVALIGLPHSGRYHIQL